MWLGSVSRDDDNEKYHYPISIVLMEDIDEAEAEGLETGTIYRHSDAGTPQHGSFIVSSRSNPGTPRHGSFIATPRSATRGSPRSRAGSYYFSTPRNSVRPTSMRPQSTVFESVSENIRQFRTVSIASMADRPLSMRSLPDRPLSMASTLSGTQVSRRPRPTSMHLPHPISRYYPVFTICITVAIWLSFILGIVLSDDLSLSSIGLHYPVSPPNFQWWFYTVAPFPVCSDERYTAWRILSEQLVHSGLWHIGGNSVSILIYGSILEMYHPLSFISTISIFETSIVTGVLGFSALSPYTGLVGASPGVYGLIGGCWYVAMAHRDLVDPVVNFVLPVVLVAQLAFDLLLFYIQFNPDTAYSSHIVGLVSGFFFTMTLTITYRKMSWPALMSSLFGMMVFSGIVGFFVWHYLIFYPPRPIVSPYLHNTNTYDKCCHLLFERMDKYPTLPKDYLVQSMRCSDN